MTTSYTPARAFRELIDLYATDGEFREQLQADPAGTVAGRGLDVPLGDSGETATLGQLLSDLPPDAIDPTMMAVASLMTADATASSGDEPQGIPTVWAFIIAIANSNATANANAVGNANATANANTLGYRSNDVVAATREIPVRMPSDYDGSDAHRVLSGMQLSEARQATLVKQSVLTGDVQGPDGEGVFHVEQRYRGQDLVIAFRTSPEAVHIVSVGLASSAMPVG